MEVKFYLVQINGGKLTDMDQYRDGIFEILAGCTDEHDEVIIGSDWFTMSKLPTLSEILTIERNLVKLGLVIEA